jgi:hypothetical protein
VVIINEHVNSATPIKNIEGTQYEHSVENDDDCLYIALKIEKRLRECIED